MLTVKGRRFGWFDNETDGVDAEDYNPMTDDKGTTDTADDENIQLQHRSLTWRRWRETSGSADHNEWPEVDRRRHLNTHDRARPAVDSAEPRLGPTRKPPRMAAWQRVQDVVQFNFFGGLLPVKLDANYADVRRCHYGGLGIGSGRN